MDKQLDAKITAFLEANKEKIYADVDRILRFDSVNGEPAEGAPYGKTVCDAIDAMLSIHALHGLKTRNFNGIMGEAVYGDGEESLGIISHVDIVPAGQGWTKPPHALTREDGMLYGRGVIDNKGPGVAALWALLAALDAGIVPRKQIVFLIGGDEERGMSDLVQFLQTEKAPDVAFTPDAGFPVIYCEKTIVRGTLTAALPQGSILKDIRGGTRVNVVPNSAEALLSRAPAGKLPEGVELTETAEGFVLQATGTAAHASMPEKGDNAIVKLLGALASLLPQGDPALSAVFGLYECCRATDGSGLNIACADEESGPLTFNLGVIRLQDGVVCGEYDIRHPSLIDPEENIFTRLPEAARRAGLETDGAIVDTGFCLPRGHALVQTLMSIYNEVNGSDDAPVAIGGGTYARKLPCAAAYGMLFEDDPETAHMADERIPEASFMKATRIFAHAIAELSQ